MWAALALSVLFVPTVLGQNNNATNPMQTRLAYAGPTGMSIAWNTFTQLTKPMVKYGLSASSLNLTSPAGISITYPTSSTYNNHVKITGLKPGTLYYYQPQPTNLTTPLTFQTSRLPGDGTPFSVALVVDMGVMGPEGLSTTVGTGAGGPLAPGDNNTIQSLQAQPGFDFLWHRMSFSYVFFTYVISYVDLFTILAGDIAYADYWLKEEIQGYLPNTTIADGFMVYERLLNRYYDQVSVVSSQKPYMVGPGNHEANCEIFRSAIARDAIFQGPPSEIDISD